MQILCRTIPLIFVSVASSSAGLADDTISPTLEWKNTWSSAFSRAVGGSQTAHAFNEDALFANPAALNKTRHPRSRKLVDVVDAPGLSVGGNGTALSALKGKTLQPSLWLKSLAANIPTGRTYFEMQALPWTVLGERGGPTFFLGMPIRSTIIASPAGSDGVSRTISNETTASAAMNMSIATRSGAAAFGLSLRPNIRWNSSLSLNLNEVGSSKSLFGSIKSGNHKTTATPVDVGFIMTAGDFWLPSFGLAVLNLPTACVDNYLNPATGKKQSICGTARTGDVQDDVDATRLDPTEVRMGISIIPRFRVGGVRLNLKISGDIYPLPITTGGKNYGYTDVNINQLTHAGVELFLGNALSTRTFSLRAGLNDTRISWGFSLPLPHFSVDASSYEAALFNDGKATKERRYLIGLSSDW